MHCLATALPLISAEFYIGSVYTSSAMLTAQSKCDVAQFCAHGVAVVASHPIALLWDIISESNARASKYARLRYLNDDCLVVNGR